MKVTPSQVRRYCRTVGRYLPCSPKHKKRILGELQQQIDVFLLNSADSSETLEDHFGLPQEVAASYVDDMNTAELLKALHVRKRVVTGIVAGIVMLLLIWIIALSVQVLDYHQAVTGWEVQTIIE